MTTDPPYTPALGLRVLTPFYDMAIALLTREQIWRNALVNQIALQPGERILDVGCGTGSLTLLLAESAPAAEISGIDPDPEVLRRAAAKARRGGVSVTYHSGFLTSAFNASHGPFDIVTSSLVFHQVPLEGKSEILAMMHQALTPGGRLCIADYGLQRTALMRFLFRRTVQTLDGLVDTQPNADGVLPRLMTQAGFADVREVAIISTPTGSISLYTATHGTEAL